MELGFSRFTVVARPRIPVSGFRARTFARDLGHHEAADLLQRTLDEEAAADEKLTEIAVGRINAEAMAAGA